MIARRAGTSALSSERHIMLPDSTELSSKKSVGEWRAIQPNLLAGANPEIWGSILKDFYFDRLKTRYLDPIEAILKMELSAGEGFAVVAIQCSLIEFLESCFQGVNYVNERRKAFSFGRWLKGMLSCHGSNNAARYRYKNSGKIFVAFLTKQEPFKRHFSKALAQDFYKSVRCGILHEARTKGKWLIHKESQASLIIDAERRILYRNNFHRALLEFINAYCEEVPLQLERQRAFIRKFDHLCE